MAKHRTRLWWAFTAMGAGLAVTLGVLCGGWWNLSNSKPPKHPARRGSDNPHVFKPTAGFRTCGTCGLPRSHKVHDVRDSAN